jgi:GDP-L-fucose synthase
MIMERILVTGGTGLVGKAVQYSSRQYSSYEWIFVGSKEVDLTDYNATFNYFNQIKPTYVIHLAARVGGLFDNIKHKADFYIQNTRINTNVLECCNHFNVKKVVSCLSTCIFPDTKRELTEEDVHSGPPHESNFGYAYSKRMIDVMNKSLYDQYGRVYTSVIPTNVYGPNDNYNLESSHVIPGLIHKCFLAKKNGTDFVVKGTGKPLRQFIHSYDLANLIVRTLFEYESISPIILADTKEYTIKQVAQYIVKTMDFKGNIVWDNTFSDGQLKKTASNKKLLNTLKDVKFINLQTGIKDVCDYFVLNYDSVRK